MKKYLILLMSFCLLCISSVSIPVHAEKPVVVWAHGSVNAVADDSDSIVDAQVLQSITEEVNKRLHALDAEKKLPFALKETDSSYEENLSDNAMVALVPLVMDDQRFETRYVIEGNAFYKSVLMTQIDIAFCYYLGSGNSLRVLHVIPLTGYALMGEKGEYTAPISKEQYQQQFIENARQLIQNELYFNNKRFLKDLDYKMVTPDTYQVTDVTISSPSAQRFYQSRLPIAQRIIASAYTRQYAASHEDITILPSVFSGKWKEDAAKQTYQLSLGDTGKYLVMEKASHGIHLDLTKVAAFEIPIKNDAHVYKNIGFTADVKDTTNGNTGTYVKQIKVLDKDNRKRDYHDLDGIFAQILTEAAKAAAEK